VRRGGDAAGESARRVGTLAVALREGARAMNERKLDADG